MTMLRTYSRKGRTAQTGDSNRDLYKSSQDSFFDSPCDPYFFDSQTSTTEETQLQHNTIPEAVFPIQTASTLTPSQAQSQTTVIPQTTAGRSQEYSVPSTRFSATDVAQRSVPTVMAVQQLPAKRKSRLSQSSSQPEHGEGAATIKAKPSTLPAQRLPQAVCSKKVSTVQTQRSRASGTSGEAVHKRQCLERASSGSTSRSRNSTGKASSNTSKQPAAPAVTVLEAQESGEHTQIVDDIVYALDGLGRHCSKTSWQDSSTALAQICASRRGKQAFRVEGLFKETMTAALSLPLEQDNLTALAFAAALLAFASGDVASRTLLAQAEAVQLAGKLLKVHSEPSTSTPAEQKLGKLFKQGPLHAAMEGRSLLTPSLVTTRALCIALGPEKSSAASETLKERLRTESGLLGLVHAVQYHADQQDTATCSSAQTSMFTRQIDAVSQGLTALEHASFACPSNEQHLVELHMQPPSQQLTPAAISPVSQDSRPQPIDMPFPAWLVQLISQAASLTQSASAHGQHVSAGIAHHSSRQWDCKQAGLSVLINMTHHNTAGCDAVMDAGGLHMAANILYSSLEPNKADDCLADGSANQEESIARDRQHALAHVGTLTAALGLLINLLENCEENRKQLKEMQFANSSSISGALQTLCRLMQATAGSSKSPSGSQHTGSEVTEQHIADNEDDGTASIVEVYSALLLGFLLTNDQSLQAEASRILGSLNPVIAAIKRCLSFYVGAGAMTSQSEESLRKLLVALCNTDVDDL